MSYDMTHGNLETRAPAPMTEVLTVRTTRLDRHLIAAAAAAQRLTVSAFVRRAILDATVGTLPSQRQRE